MKWCTWQSIGPKDVEAHSKKRKGVDEVHAEVEDALEKHHHQTQLCKTGTFPVCMSSFKSREHSFHDLKWRYTQDLFITIKHTLCIFKKAVYYLNGGLNYCPRADGSGQWKHEQITD